MKSASTKLPGLVQRTARTACALASSAALVLASLPALSAGVALSALTGPAHAQGKARNHIVIQPGSGQSQKMIRLGLDKSIVVDLPTDAHDILVANPDVADAVTRTSRRLYVFGKEIGQTNVFVFDGSGNQIAALEIIIERDIAGLEDTIARLIPGSEVRAEMINDNIVLTGNVDTPQAAAMAIRLAEIFVSGGEQTAQEQPAATTGLLGGTTEAPTSDVVNLLKIAGEDQVHLKVVIAEIQRSVVKQLGINSTFSNDNSDGFGFSVISGSSPSFSHMIGIGGGAFNFSDTIGALAGTYNALERNGVMRTLAEPSLTAVSGEKAHFQVGGTYYTPNRVSDDDNGVAVEYQEIDYGVALTFTPVVLTAGRISLKIRTEVSEPTSQDVLPLRRDINLLSIRKRMADTTVELPSGGSMVIGGLVQDDVRQAINGHPGLMKVPFFGSLFRSREFVRNESEVVVIVTPYLVRPAARSKLVQPDENFQPASDAAGYFMGRVNRVFGTKQGDLPKGRYTGSIGFIFD